jgi:hypothetical protein
MLDLEPATEYDLRVTAVNGAGDKVAKYEFVTIGTSEPTRTMTCGSVALAPEMSQFIELSSTMIILNLSAWKDGGCSMSYFAIENKKK